MVRRIFLLGFMLLLNGCGGGGGSTTSSVAVSDSPTVTAPVSYACDTAKEAAAAPHTSVYVNQLPLAPSAGSTTVESWTVQIDGKPYVLNMAITWPAASVPIRGVVINGHGHSPTQTTMLPTDMVNPYWDAQMVSKGYVSVTVARRGNFGSTGDRVFTDAVMLDQYNKKQISYADYELAAQKYQAASLIAILDLMALDNRFKPYLKTIFLIGASGGANTVVQTAVDSSVFRQATKKALVRLTGLDSMFDINSDALPGVSEYSARIAKDAVPSLWVGGQDDPITSPGQLACQFKFFNQASGFTNAFYLVPGLGHFGFESLFSPTLLPSFSSYMTSRGFDGF